MRKYVRKIIIAYCHIILITKKNSKEILEYLDSEEKLDIQVRLLISVINSNSFTEQQHRVVDIVEIELGHEIPEQTKKALYSICNSDEK